MPRPYQRNKILSPISNKQYIYILHYRIVKSYVVFLSLSPDSLQKLSIKWLICSWIVFQTVHSCVSSSATYIYKLQKQHICVISTESTYLNICNMYLYLCILPVFSLQWKPIKPYLSFIPMNKCIVSLFCCFMFIFPKSSRDKHANIRARSA